MDISLIQQNIIDNDSETKEYYFTLLNGLYVLHIFNPNSESINTHLEDKKFYKILISMLFDKDKKLTLKPDISLINPFNLSYVECAHINTCTAGSLISRNRETTNKEYGTIFFKTPTTLSHWPTSCSCS